MSLLKDLEKRRVFEAELIAEVRQLRQEMTASIARAAGRLTNDVLEVATRAFPTAGLIALQYRVPAGSIEVSNAATHDVTVVAAPADSGAPSVGTGVYVVPAGATRVVNVASPEITLYGTSGDTISFQVFASGGASRPSLNAVDGGAP